MKNNTINTFIFVLLSLLWAACNPSQPKEDLPPPNILWITSEDNSPFLGAYGDEFATTPVLDSLASVGVLYENAFAAAPVCAPTRNTIITGMYANSLGTENMRSNYPIPDFVKFYPTFLQEAGYYVTNNVKKDYNTIDQPEAWNESSNEASYRNRKPGQPFFHIRNFTRSHESSIHDSIPMDQLVHDPETVPIPAYHPRTPEMKHDWAQYYDRITQLDTMVGQVLQELKADGLADSTIIFYYSDHGGILGRSKRFMFESGLRVPLIIYFPEMYRHLAPAQPGSKTDRIVTFVDFAPTLLSLAGVPIPEHMQGKPFLGEQQTAPRDYGYNFRGRMDERFDLVRSVRDKEFRYIRNYMPHKIYGQHIAYLWRAPSMRSWEREYKKGNLNEIQSKFWGPKPVEELYDIKADPDNINNLADDPEYQEVLERMRQANREWIFEIRDAGFIPEPMLLEIARKMPPFNYVRKDDFPFEKIYETADMASADDPDFSSIIKRLNDSNPIIRYWAATGCIIHADEAGAAKETLITLQDDPETVVKIAAAEALYKMGEVNLALNMLEEALQSDNMMARTQAMNVLELMDPEDAVKALEAVKQIIPEQDSNEYDVRAAKTFVEKYAAL